MKWCVVIDDDPMVANSLEHHVLKHPGLLWLGHCASASGLAQLVKDQRPDIYFIDINLPDADGPSIARQLPEDVKVVLISGAKPANETSWPKNVKGFLIKPILPKSFREMVAKLEQENQQAAKSPKEEKLHIKIGTLYKSFAVQEVVALVAKEGETHIQTKTGVHVSTWSLERCLQRLPKHLFTPFFHEKVWVQTAYINQSNEDAIITAFGTIEL